MSLVEFHLFQKCVPSLSPVQFPFDSPYSEKQESFGIQTSW